jgi:molecular chaperone GrpE
MKRKEEKKKASAEETSEELHRDKAVGIEANEAEAAPEQAFEAADLKKQLENKSQEAQENFNKFLRMQAEFDNYKKRTAREKEELYITSLEKVMKELLPIVDNMERALASFRTTGLDSSYADGVDMIQKQLFSVLEKNGLKEIQAEGQDFDPNIHHAVMQVEGTKEEENKVKAVLQKGYYLGSRVIRPAMVQVVGNN